MVKYPVFFEKVINPIIQLVPPLTTHPSLPENENPEQTNYISPPLVTNKAEYSVADVLNNKISLLDQNIKVKGQIKINIIYGDPPCFGEPNCSSRIITDLYLYDIADKTKGILIYKNDAKYPCTANPLICGDFRDGDTVTINAILRKKDSYYLNISGSVDIWTIQQREQCSRPTDAYGPKYETVTGIYNSREVTPGGGPLVILRTNAGPDMGMPAGQAVNITDGLYIELGSIPTGTKITLFSYVSSSLSGANPPFSCFEIN